MTETALAPMILVADTSLALDDGGAEIELSEQGEVLDRISYGSTVGVVADNAYLDSSLVVYPVGDSSHLRSSLKSVQRVTAGPFSGLGGVVVVGGLDPGIEPLPVASVAEAVLRRGGKVYRNAVPSG